MEDTMQMDEFISKVMDSSAKFRGIYCRRESRDCLKSPLRCALLRKGAADELERLLLHISDESNDFIDTGYIFTWWDYEG